MTADLAFEDGSHLMPIPSTVSLADLKIVGVVEGWTCPECNATICASLCETKDGHEYVGHWHTAGPEFTDHEPTPLP